MNYRTGLIAGIASLLVVAGNAAAEEATPAQDAKATQQQQPKKPAAEPAKCTHAPGSRIRLSTPEDCAKASRGPFRSYSKEDLDRTGETNMADALRKLDPSFR